MSKSSNDYNYDEIEEKRSKEIEEEEKAQENFERFVKQMEDSAE